MPGLTSRNAAGGRQLRTKPENPYPVEFCVGSVLSGYIDPGFAVVSSIQKARPIGELWPVTISICFQSRCDTHLQVGYSK
jgi:hypothetical protein